MLNALAKLEKKWLKNLAPMVWADRITTRASTDYAPYRLVFGQECVLPVELKAASWAVIAWERVRTLEDLLVVRARQLERKEEEIFTVQESIRPSRLRNKAQFDKVHHSNNNTSGTTTWWISTTTPSPTSLKTGLYSGQHHEQTYLLFPHLIRLLR